MKQQPYIVKDVCFEGIAFITWSDNVIFRVTREMHIISVNDTCSTEPTDWLTIPESLDIGMTEHQRRCKISKARAQYTFSRFKPENLQREDSVYNLNGIQGL